MDINMKHVVILTGLFFLLLGTNAFAQTKMIGHKSHSGNKANFTLMEEGNFGEPPMPIVPRVITKISDTLFVVTYSGYRIKRDTIVMNPPLSPKTLKRLIPGVILKGFDQDFKKTPKHGNVVVPSDKLEPLNREDDLVSIVLLLGAISAIVGLYTWYNHDNR